MDKKPPITGLDHIALAVSDLQNSMTWYRDILGLEVVQDPEHWGPYPIMLLAHGSGIALFPAKHPERPKETQGKIRFLHLAFQVENQAFDDWRKRFDRLGLSYRFEDLHHFHSIFLLDPDGYEIELTTMRKPIPPS